MTIAEIQRGVLLMSPCRKRVWAHLMGEGTASGRPHSALAAIIAAVAEANQCVVTDNEKDFAGLAVLDPIRAASH